MTADRLREAAAILRERAEAATPGEWWFSPLLGTVYACGDSECETPVTGDYGTAQDNRLIATMGPAVGLALADWLDAEAGTATLRGLDPHSGPAAVAVADAILGGEQA